MSKRFKKIIYYLSTAIISGCVLIMFVVQPGINDNESSMFIDMICGNASKPFVYRTLLPTTVRLLAAPVPEQLRSSISRKIEENVSLRKLFLKLKWEKEYAVEYSFAMILMFFSLWGFSIAVKYFFSLFFKTSDWFAGSVSILALAGLPPMFQYTSFLYDFPLLLFYTLGLIFIYKQDWKTFLIIFLIGCFNKETTILLTLIFYIFYRNKLQKDLFVKLLIAQLGIFIIAKVLLYAAFINNPGTFVEFHLVDHNLRLLTGYKLPFVVSILGMILFVFYKWNEKPLFLKHSLIPLIPLFILTLFLGYVDELRDYYEVYPVIILLTSYSIARILSVKIGIWEYYQTI